MQICFILALNLPKNWFRVESETLRSCVIPRKACSWCVSSGLDSCVGQRWPSSSQREWAYWKNHTEVRIHTLYQITQLTTLSSLEYHPSFILSGQPPLPPPPLLPHHRVRTPVTPQSRPLQLGSSSDWLWLLVLPSCLWWIRSALISPREASWLYNVP